jgi:hypothetical protein
MTRSALGLLAIVAVSGTAGVATAHNKEFSNSVVVKEARQYAPNVDSYGGRVKSGNARCKRHREVQVYRVDVTPEVRLFSTRTGPGGYWRRKGPDLPDGAKVYALIETKVLASNAAHDHTCPVDRSPVRTMPYP